MTHFSKILFSLSCSIACLGCVTAPIRTDPQGIDRKLTLASYIEEGELIALVAGTRVARMREKSDYFPIEVAVANKGLPGLTLTLESFELIDADGNRYPAVSGDELQRGYGNVDTDRRLAELPPVLLTKYATYESLNLGLTTSFDRPMQRTIKLARFSYFTDFIYFPRPEKGLRGHRFELFLKAPELEDPVFVRFEIK